MHASGTTKHQAKGHPVQRAAAGCMDGNDVHDTGHTGPSNTGPSNTGPSKTRASQTPEDSHGGKQMASTGGICGPLVPVRPDPDPVAGLVGSVVLWYQ